ncbi:MAG: hypothetical protein WC867_01010 [Candidatus Pacearchaeota archaeon]|jgi:hypothetical protein
MSLELVIEKKEESEKRFLNVWVNPTNKLIRIENNEFNTGRYLTLYSNEINSQNPLLVFNYLKKYSIDGLYLAKLIEDDDSLFVEKRENLTQGNIFYLELYFPKSSLITLTNNSLYFGLLSRKG